MNKKVALARALLALTLVIIASVDANAADADGRRWKPVRRVDCPSFPTGCNSTGDMFSPQVAVHRGGDSVAVWQIVDQGAAHILASRYSIATRSWGASIPVDDAVGGASDAQVAIDANGNATLVWVQADGVHARRLLANGTLEASTALQSLTGQGSSPQVAVAANGDATVVWHQLEGARNRTWVRRYTASANRWDSAAATLDANTGEATFPQVAVDPRGNALVLWQQDDVRVGSNRYSASEQRWLGPVTIQSAAASASSVQVKLDARGIGRAVWVGFDSTTNRNRVWSSRFVDQWEPAVAIDSNLGDATQPQVGVDADSNAVVVWNAFDGTRTSVWSSRFVAGRGQWEGARLVESLDGDAFSPSIDFDGAGNAVVTWYQKLAGAQFFSIYAARYTPATTLQDSWQTPALIETADEGNAFVPRVGFDGNGFATAVWYQSNGQRFGINSSRYGVRQWGIPQPLEVNHPGASVLPHVAVDAAGHALAVWNDVNATGVGGTIMWNRYTHGQGWGTGRPLSNLATSKSHPDFEFDVNGNALIAWQNGNMVWSRYTANGDWSPVTPISPNSLMAAPATFPDIAVNASGNAFVVWEAGDLQIFATRFNAGQWERPVSISTGTGVSRNPKIVIDEFGNAIAVWSQNSGNTNTEQAWGKRYLAGWKAPFSIGLAGDQLADVQSLTLDSTGGAFAVGVSRTFGLTDVWWNRFAAGVWNGTGQRMQPNEEVTTSSPQVVSDGRAGALAVWWQSTAAGTVLRSRRYAAARADWDPIVDVQQQATSDTISTFKVATNSLGDAIVVWAQCDFFATRCAVLSSNATADGGWSAPAAVGAVRGTVPDVAIDANGAALAVWVDVGNVIWGNRFE